LDDDDFRTFENAGWERLADVYHDYYARSTCQAVDPLLDALNLNAGSKLLDVACGPGYLAAAAAKLGAEVTGIDFASAMVALARKLHPELTFENGDAEALQFPVDSFDAVGSNFGWHHLMHPEKALSEAFRVLKPGGSVAITVWARADKAVAMGIVLDAIRKYGKLDVGLPEAPPFFRFSDHDELRRGLHVAGFVDAQVREVHQVWSLRAPETSLHAVMHGGVRIAAILKKQSADALRRIEDAVTADSMRYLASGVHYIPTPAVLGWARKDPR
jgi:ubiquinone/menaquinone biosynthesis C-methylase UbiE